MSPHIVFSWCHDTALADSITALFLDNLSTSYISHSELQYGRADAPNKWSKDLPQTLAADIAAALSTETSTQHFRLATAFSGATLLAVAFISIDTEKETPHPFATLEDMVVSPAARGKGVGQTMLDWLSKELQAQGIQRLFLESGINNHAAHNFFERHDFKPVSVVMMKELTQP